MNTFDTEIAVRTLWGEARGEGPDGLAAVAAVLINRMYDGRWGDSLAEVCLAPLQFSCWNAHDPNRVQMARLAPDDLVLAHCRAALIAAMAGTDPTGGATHYIVAGTDAAWLAGATATVRIGHHQFYKDVA